MIHRSLLAVKTFAKIETKRAFRDKVALFFIFIFPLFFLFIFGGLFGKNSSVSFNVALINESKSQIATTFVESIGGENRVVKVKKDVTTMDGAKQKLERSEIDAIIVLPEQFGVIAAGQSAPTGQAKVIYNQSNEQGAQALTAVLQEVFKQMNKEATDLTETFTVSSESTADKSLSRFDYTFAGLLGFSVLSLGIFGPTQVFPQLKKQGVLRRYHTTTLKVWQYFVANVISQAAVGLLSVAFLFIVALVVFDLNMRGDYFSLVAIVALGITVLFGIGLAVGGWAKNENQAAPLANLISFPMMFLSGTFFPRYAMPEWLRGLSGYLPLTPVIDGIRGVVAEGKTIFELGPQLALLAVWGVVVYFIAFKVFRWE